jgi:hypothetical protein
MNVKELIEVLQRFDPSLDVRVIRHYYHDPIEDRDIFVVDYGHGADHPHLVIT